MEDIVVKKVQTWLQQIVIDLNFCPFAQKPFIEDKIRYTVFQDSSISHINSFLLSECNILTQNPEIETTLIIFPNQLKSFTAFLQQVKQSNLFLDRKKLIQKFQLAHFHPHYVFANQEEADAANYTNRSPFPILHIIRQESLTQVLKNVKNPHLIPTNNIKVANNKGVAYFQALLSQIHQMQ